MNYGGVVTLVTVERTQKANGRYEVTGQTEREVFANIASVTRSEFFAAKQAGIEMVLSVNIRAADYENEKLLLHNGRRYKIERTFTKDGETLQLNCSELGEGA